MPKLVVLEPLESPWKRRICDQLLVRPFISIGIEQTQTRQYWLFTIEEQMRNRLIGSAFARRERRINEKYPRLECRSYFPPHTDKVWPKVGTDFTSPNRMTIGRQSVFKHWPRVFHPVYLCAKRSHLPVRYPLHFRCRLHSENDDPGQLEFLSSKRE